MCKGCKIFGAALRQITAVNKITLQAGGNGGRGDGVRVSFVLRRVKALGFLKRRLSTAWERRPLKNRSREGNKIHWLLRWYLAAQPNRHSFWKRGPKLPSLPPSPLRPRPPPRERALSDDGVRLTRLAFWSAERTDGRTDDRTGWGGRARSAADRVDGERGGVVRSTIAFASWNGRNGINERHNEMYGHVLVSSW